MYNSQLPFPNFNLGLVPPASQPNQGKPIEMQSQYQPTDGTAQYTSGSQPVTQQQTNLEEDDEDFDDFIDPVEAQPQQQQPPKSPPKQLTEEEKRKLEEEERLKRLDLINSAFDEAFLEEEPGKKVEEESKQASQQDTQVEEQKSAFGSQENAASSGWANFNFGDNTASSGNDWQSAATGWAQPSAPVAEETKIQGKPTQQEEDSDFEDFADPENEGQGAQSEDNKMEVDDDDPFAAALEPEAPKLEKKETSEDAFPSLFDQTSTPRVQIDEKESDIRMSFPSQEMWSKNFGAKKEDKEESPKDTGGWAGGGFGFGASNFKFGQETIKEEDEDDFKDIVDMKKGTEKQVKKDDSFDDFAEPEPQETETREIKPLESKKEKQIKPLQLKTASSNPPESNSWANFNFEQKQEDGRKSELTDNAWANFSNPIEQKSDQPKTDKGKNLDDPFGSMDDPFKDAFGESAEKPKPSKDQQKDEDDSDFDDFADPVEEPAQDTVQINFPSKLEAESKPKEFKDEDLFHRTGFLDAPKKDKKKETKLDDQKEAEPLGHTKTVLMNKIAKTFGDSANLDFDHLPESSSPVFTKEYLKDKLENKEEMKKVADALVKQENYDEAQKIWTHIDLIDKVNKALADKQKAAAEEKYELAMKLRDDANSYKEQMLNEKQIVALFNAPHPHKQPTLKNLLNQVLYRIDDSLAEYFVPKYLEKVQKIDDRDFEAKVELKKEAMLEALILLKVTHIGIDEYKLNCDEVVPFVLKEVQENLLILNELKTQEEEVLDALKEEEKFTTFLKGIKALYQIITNMRESAELLDLIDTKYAMDIEVFCQVI